MMTRTTILLPPTVKRRALAAARAAGTSLGAVVRGSLDQTLPLPARRQQAARQRAAIAAMLQFGEGAQPGPADLAANHDQYLYDDYAPPPSV